MADEGEAGVSPRSKRKRVPFRVHAFFRAPQVSTHAIVHKHHRVIGGLINIKIQALQKAESVFLSLAVAR